MHIFLRRRKPTVGIYANSKAVALCQANLVRGDISIDNIIYLERGFNLDETEIVLEIHKLLKEYNFNIGRANITIPYRSLIKSYLELPYMRPKYTLRYVRRELQRIYGIDPNLYHFSFYTLTIRPYSDYYVQRILAFGVPKEFISLYRAQFNKLGLKINSFVLPLDSQLAVLKIINKNIVKEEDIICLVYIEESLEIFFYHEGDVIFTTSISAFKGDMDNLKIELRRIFNHFYMTNYYTDIDIVILSGICYNEKRDRYLSLFDELGYESIWLNTKMLDIEYNFNDKKIPLAQCINALGASVYC